MIATCGIDPTPTELAGFLAIPPGVAQPRTYDGFKAWNMGEVIAMACAFG
jgi:hypothetical protein